MGSKARHAKDIIAKMMASRRPDQIYVEPFVGGGNVLNKVPHGAGRIANDKNEFMVALLDALGNHGWVPPTEMNEAIYKRLKKSKPESHVTMEQKAFYALAATGVTFGSKWFDSWVKEDARWRQACEAALDDAPGLAGVEFHSGSYDALDVPEGALVYCDPPYVGTADYMGSKTTIKVGTALSANLWRSAPFWKWADRLIDGKGCTVYVSEYTGPSPVEVYGKVWSPDLRAEYNAACAAARAMDPKDSSITTGDFELARYRITKLEDKAMEAGRALAERWTSVWDKEVISDFSTTRTVEDSGKRETEHLFTRAP